MLILYAEGFLKFTAAYTVLFLSNNNPYNFADILIEDPRKRNIKS
jgi:hypothetical protein